MGMCICTSLPVCTLKVSQATVASKHGPRVVLTISLLGSAVTCCLFGTATSIQEAIAIRLMQGVFAGAIGVARGCVTSITDQSNEGRAYAILGYVVDVQLMPPVVISCFFQLLLGIWWCIGRNYRWHL